MTGLAHAVTAVRKAQKKSGKPLAVVLAGHNGSGKSTLWYGHLANSFQIPLVNADRLMMSILPEVQKGRCLPSWASTIRDSNESWMQVAQKGVHAFVAQAMASNVPFAMETVFSHWKMRADGTIESKIDQILELKKAGYFVLLLFVGLANKQLSIARVETRVTQGGHGVATKKLLSRFPRTQMAIKLATNVADAAILMDNSRTQKQAFTVCRVQLRKKTVYDCRNGANRIPMAIREWMDVVSPQ
jgi:predicted ABC-type ATPase